MIVRIVIRTKSRKKPADERESGFRQLIRAASRTPYYEPLILSGSGWKEHELSELPYVEVADLRSAPEKFRNPEWAAAWSPELHFPFPRPSRTALLASGYSEINGLQCFPGGWSPRLNQFEPEVLAGPVNRLRNLALAALAKRIRLAPIRQALIAFCGIDSGSLTPDDRDLFWRVFQVPVFEQLVLQGETLATECEAHQGMHVFPNKAIFEFRERKAGQELIVSCLRPLPLPVLRWATGLTTSLHETTCGCGQCSPRLVQPAHMIQATNPSPAGGMLVETRPMPRLRVMAASAGARI